ncbi:MAG: hypothetical protein H7840_09230 [Alphaproteobacteria bacterium]
MIEPRNKHLVVEGADDKHAIIHLMKAQGITWGEKRPEWPVTLHDAKGVENILDPDKMEALLAIPGAAIIGFVVDADSDFESRWRKLRGACLTRHPQLPESFPAAGLVTENERGQRLGIWIMPDNANKGMLETFLHYLVPGDDNVWPMAQQAAAKAKENGAPFLPKHAVKADIHTWLAWQDPPGQSFGLALTKNALDPASPTAQPFVAWFCDLFQITVPVPMTAAVESLAAV